MTTCLQLILIPPSSEKSIWLTSRLVLLLGALLNNLSKEIWKSKTLTKRLLCNLYSRYFQEVKHFCTCSSWRWTILKYSFKLQKVPSYAFHIFETWMVSAWWIWLLKMIKLRQQTCFLNILLIKRLTIIREWLECTFQSFLSWIWAILICTWSREAYKLSKPNNIRDKRLMNSLKLPELHTQTFGQQSNGSTVNYSQIILKVKKSKFTSWTAHWFMNLQKKEANSSDRCQLQKICSSLTLKISGSLYYSNGQSFSLTSSDIYSYPS